MIAKTFNDLVDEATQRIHMGLLEGGGREMKSRVHVSLDQAIRWYIEQEKAKRLLTAVQRPRIKHKVRRT